VITTRKSLGLEQGVWVKSESLENSAKRFLS